MSKAPSHPKMTIFSATTFILMLESFFPLFPEHLGLVQCVSARGRSGQALSSHPDQLKFQSHAEPWHPTLGKRNRCTDNKTHSCQQLLTKHEKGAGVNLERPELQIWTASGRCTLSIRDADIISAKSSSCFPQSSSGRGSASWHLSKPQPHWSSTQSAHPRYQSWIR